MCPNGAVVLLDDDVTPPGRLSIGSHGYPQIWHDGHVGLLHRWLLGLTRGDGMIGDHINGDRLDNRRANLRVVTPGGSSQNRRGYARSGYRNVYRSRSGRWEAKCKIDRTPVYLGTFDTPEEAARVAAAWRSANMPYAVNR